MGVLKVQVPPGSGNWVPIGGGGGASWDYSHVRGTADLSNATGAAQPVPGLSIVKSCPGPTTVYRVLVTLDVETGSSICAYTIYVDGVGQQVQTTNVNGRMMFANEYRITGLAAGNHTFSVAGWAAAGTFVVRGGTSTLSVESVPSSGDVATQPAVIFRGQTTSNVVTETNINYTETEDTHNGWNNTGVYTVPVPGVYQVTVGFKSSGSASLPYKIMKNGSPVLFGPNTVAAAYTGGSLSGLVRCTTGDTISARCLTSYTPQADTPADSNYMHISLVGGTSPTLTVEAPVGAIMAHAGATAPAGWLLCQGQAVSRNTYADLYAAIGTVYGVGDGTTTFNLPDLRGRVAAGLSTDTEFNTLGKTGGEKAHVQTIAEMPSHTHPPAAGSAYFVTYAHPSGSGLSWAGGPSLTTPTATGATGGGTAANNLQPYQVVNWIIKVGASIPVAADTGWIGVAFTAPWQNYGSGWQPVQYRKVGNRVEFRGLAVSQGASSAGGAVFTLPVGFRPLNNTMWLTGTSMTPGYCRVDPAPSTGVVSPSIAHALGAYLSFDNIFLYTD